MRVNYNNIPKELRELNQWVCWKEADKCPVNPRTGKNAQANNPETWGSFDAAVKHYEKAQWKRPWRSRFCLF